jgi:AcrR family transcriptional regulator
MVRMLETRLHTRRRRRTLRRRSTAGVRAGGRSARIVRAVLDATLDALGQGGYAALRIEDIAGAAGVNKTTVYRRWPTRADLVIAALSRLVAAPRAADTGMIERDLVDTFVQTTSLRVTPSGRSVLRALLAECGQPEVDRVIATLREQHRAPGREILQRAKRRGELGPGTDVEVLLDVLMGAVYARLRATSAPPGRVWLTAVVQLVVAGATTVHRPSERTAAGRRRRGGPR